MRFILPALLATLIAAPISGSTTDAWDTFRKQVAEACIALIDTPGQAEIDVNPFGSEHFGLALITLTSDIGTDRLACIYDKAKGTAELTAPFAGPIVGE